MILDKIENLGFYRLGPAFDKAVEFIETLTVNTEDGKHHIENDDIYAVVMTYNTLNFEDAVLETHRKYIDIQAVVDGRELLCWAPKEGLEVKKKYDEDKDAEFYIPPETMPSKNIMTPGMFGVFFPEDAHMPQVSLTKQSESVKKVVIKIKKSLLKIGA